MSATTSGDAGGNHSFSAFGLWRVYLVTPSLTRYSQTVNFAAAPVPYRIGGRITGQPALQNSAMLKTWGPRFEISRAKLVRAAGEGRFSARRYGADTWPCMKPVPFAG